MSEREDLPAIAESAAAPPARPLTFGEILDRVVQLMRGNLRPFLKIAALPAGIVAAIQVVLIAAVLSISRPWAHPDPGAIAPRAIGLVAAICFMCLSMVVHALYAPAGIHAALQADRGAGITFHDAYALALRKAGRYIWLSILFLLIVVGAVILLAAIVAGAGVLIAAASKGSAQPSMPFVFFPFILLLYLGLMIIASLAIIWLALAYPACVAEDLPAWTSIRRSVVLTRGGSGRIFLLLLVLYALSYAATLVAEFAVAIPASVIALAMMLLRIPLNPRGYVGLVFGGVCFFAELYLLMACVMATCTTSLAVLYRDQRLRHEVCGSTLCAQSEKIGE